MRYGPSNSKTEGAESMFSRLFKSADTKMAEAELKSERGGPHAFAYGIIADDIRYRIRHNNGAEVKARRKEGLTYNSIIKLTAKTILDQELMQGRHYVYRGVLSMTGQPLYSLYASIVTEIEVIPGWSEELGRKELDSMREEIKASG